MQEVMTFVSALPHSVSCTIFIHSRIFLSIAEYSDCAACEMKLLSF